jgi:hypothetical protein
MFPYDSFNVEFLQNTYKLFEEVNESGCTASYSSAQSV